MRSEGASYKIDGGYKPVTTFARLEQSRLTRDFTKDILRKRALGEENPIVQPELTDQSASVITRIARAVNSSKVKAVGLLFPIIAGLPACADNTVDSTTTTPSITTTIPETTTTEPTTTTILEPSTTTTTVPETTTTTEAEYPFNLPSNIDQATDEIKDQTTDNNIELGLVKVENGEYVVFNPDNNYRKTYNVDYIIASGRLGRIYTITEQDFINQGQTVDKVILDLIFAENESGEPFIVSFDLGRTTDPASFSLSADPYQNDVTGLDPVQLAEIFNENSQLGRIFQKRLERFAQVTIRFPILENVGNDMLNNYLKLCPSQLTNDQCRALIENEVKNYDVNDRLYQILLTKDFRTENEFLADESVSIAYFVTLFTKNTDLIP